MTTPSKPDPQATVESRRVVVPRVRQCTPDIGVLIDPSLLAEERGWGRDLGRRPEAGAFIGVERWRRISETWDEPDPDDIDDAIEIAARLADDVSALEPLRRA